MPTTPFSNLFVNHVHLLPGSPRDDATPDAFKRLCDVIGIEGAVCFAPFSTQMEQSGETLNHNVWLAEQLKSRPGWYGYGTLDPLRPAPDQVRQIAELGFKGIKLHAPFQHFAFDSDWAMVAFEAMSTHNLVADFHLGVHGYRLRDYDPLLIDEITYRFPDLRVVLEHVGGWHYYRQVLGVISNSNYRHLGGKRAFAGIATVFNAVEQRFWYLGQEGMNDCRWQIGAKHLIYGLDFPYNGEDRIRHDLQQIAALDWPDEEKQMLLGENLRSLLGLTS